MWPDVGPNRSGPLIGSDGRVRPRRSCSIATHHALIGSSLLLLAGCATGADTWTSSLGRETHFAAIRRQTEEQQRIDDRECEAWTRATKGPKEPLPTAELRYGACMIARGYRADLTGSPVSSPVERPLNTTLDDMRACRIGRYDAWVDWTGGFAGVAMTKVILNHLAVSCLAKRGYVVKDAWYARFDDAPTPPQPTTDSPPIVPSIPPQPTAASASIVPSTPLQPTTDSASIVQSAPPPFPPPPSPKVARQPGLTPTPASAPAASDSSQGWILGHWNSLAGMSGSVDGLAHFAFRREGERSEIKWVMTRSGWFSGVQTTQKASGSVTKISESDLELVGKYDSSNLGNVAGQPVRHSFTREGDLLKGYELASDGTQSSLSLKRAR